MEYKLELVAVPVSDVDRSKAFYAERLGFNVDVDFHPNANFRVVQLTPPGSACSITIGIGVSADMKPGCIKGLHLIVNDIEAARAELVGRGLQLGEIIHFVDGSPVPGPDPARGDYNSFMPFDDPDGNGWLVQEVRHGAGGK